MFEKLCGKDRLKNIVLTTTMWDDIEESEGFDRERELKAKYWAAMIRQGSSVVRFHNTPESAWDIIDIFLQTPNSPSALLLQEEMVDMIKELHETEAGKALYTSLEYTVQRQREMLSKIRAETRRQADETVLAVLKSEYDQVNKQLASTITEMQKLKVPITRRFLNILGQRQSM
jgi:hypothetical protein